MRLLDYLHGPEPISSPFNASSASWDADLLECQAKHTTLEGKPVASPHINGFWIIHMINSTSHEHK